LPVLAQGRGIRQREREQAAEQRGWSRRRGHLAGSDAKVRQQSCVFFAVREMPPRRAPSGAPPGGLLARRANMWRKTHRTEQTRNIKEL
jgi:hypothetical protein